MNDNTFMQSIDSVLMNLGMYRLCDIKIDKNYDRSSFDKSVLFSNGKISFTLIHLLIKDDYPTVKLTFEITDASIKDKVEVEFGEFFKPSRSERADKGFESISINNRIELVGENSADIYESCCLKIKDPQIQNLLLKYIL